MVATLLPVEGEGKAILKGVAAAADERDVIFVPAGMRHNVQNTGGGELTLFT